MGRGADEDLGGRAGDGDDDEERLEERRLVAGIREADPAALAGFVRRYRPLLLRRARQMRVGELDRDALVMTVLDAVALRIAGGAEPRHLATYVLTAFRNHVVGELRRDAARSRQLALHSEDVGGVRVLTLGCSAHLVSAVREPGASDADANAVSPAVARFTQHLLRAMSVGDRRMLRWMANGVGAREIGEWLGITHGAARVRISRLRARTAAEARAYWERCAADDRVALAPLFRRLGLLTDPTPVARTVHGASAPAEVYDPYAS